MQKLRFFVIMVLIVGQFSNLAFPPREWRSTQEHFFLGFAGNYGMGAFWWWRLTIQSDQKFSLLVSTDMLMSFVHTGTVTMVGDEILLNATDPDFAMPSRLLAVEWGQRQYLIPVEEIEDFCQYVEARWEPRTFSSGIFYLQEGDWDVPAFGAPLSLRGELICP